MNFSQSFRWSFYASGYVALYTGFLLLFFLERPADFFPVWKQLLLKVHIASVVLWLFTCGMLFSIHVIPQLKAGITKGRKTGIALIAILILMIISGYALQIISHLPSLSIMRYAHSVTGIAFTIFFAVHLFLIRTTLRTAILATLVVSLLGASPFFFLKAETSYPDEISLVPQASDAKRKLVSRTLPAMGTLLQITIACESESACEDDFSHAEKTIRKIDEKMSIYHESEVTRINASSGTPEFMQPVSPETIEVISAGLKVARSSRGAFDPTIAPLVEVYGLYRNNSGETINLPSAQSLGAAKALVNFRKVVVASNRVGLKEKQMRLDLGAIAKGYALDKIAAGFGAREFALNFGGHILARNLSQNTEVLDPRDDKRVIMRCQFSNGSLSISAQNQRFVVSGSRKIGHLIDPRTGAPGENNLFSAVFHKSAMYADAWSTALFFDDADAFTKRKLAAYRFSSNGDLRATEQAKAQRICVSTTG